jgi:hypothetical protein
MNSPLGVCPDLRVATRARREDLTRERIELKYLIAGDLLDAFLRGVSAAASSPFFRIEESRITTVYLDRPDGRLARGALSGSPRSVRLRLREYLPSEGAGSSPHVWVEVKRLEGTTSRKIRFPLSKKLLSPFLRGYVDARMHERFGEGLRRVREITGGGPLVAVGAVSCRRRAVEGGNPRARFTLDREVSYHVGDFGLAEGRGAPDRDALGPPAVTDAGAIAELKFRGRRLPPSWGPFLRRFPPVEFSKFRVLSALVLSDARAAAVAAD